MPLLLQELLHVSGGRVMTTVAEVCEGQGARLARGEAEVLRQGRACHLGCGGVSSLCLAIEGLCEVIG